MTVAWRRKPERSCTADALAAAFALLLLVDAAAGPFQGRPWVLSEPTPIVGTNLGFHGLTIERPELPSGFEEVLSDETDLQAVFGDLYRDPLLAEVIISLYDQPMDPAALNQFAGGCVRAGQEALRESARAERPDRNSELDGGLLHGSAFQLGDVFALERVVVFRLDYLIRVDVLY